MARLGLPFGPIGDALLWLASDQNGDGSWDDVYPMIVTPTVLESLTTIDPGSSLRPVGASWLSGQSAANYEFRARQIAGLAGIPGYEALVSSLAAQLIAARNPATTNTLLPNWPEGGWGLDAGYETDCLTTALALKALDAAGLSGGFKVIGRSVAAGTTNTHQWDIASSATKARIFITVSGSTVRLRMKQGTPPGAGDPFFSLPPGTFLITYPDSGLPFTPGHNYITVQNVTGTAAIYTMTASYQTPSFDTRSLDEALEYLRQSQNGDGGWGLQRGQATEIYTTFHVILTLLEYLNYEFSGDVTQGTTYVRSQQLGDGSFGYTGTGIPYVTALAALGLIRSQTYPFNADTEEAISALFAQQGMDGSWAGEAYDTALALMALWVQNQPPTANAGIDQNVSDADGNCVQAVTLNGSGADVDGSVASVVWTENGVEIATGLAPMVTLAVGTHVLILTVTDNEGRSTSDSVTINVIGTGVPTNQCHCCLPEGGCEAFDPIACPAAGGTPIPGACAIEACCLDNDACEMFDVTCCALEGGTSLAGEECQDPLSTTLTCCLPSGECDFLDPSCCILEGGTPQDQVNDFCTSPEACCLPDGSCREIDPLCCLDLLGTPRGLGSVCAPDEACCLSDQSCEMLDPECCAGIGAIPEGTGTACTASASCCLPDNSCELLDPLCCADSGGESAAGVCTPLQACCLPDDSCADRVPVCCVQQGGTPSGVGTACTAPQACCMPDDTCAMLDPECCLEQGGAPAGVGTACSSAKACCLPDDSCEVLDPACCVTLGGSPQGAGTSCTAPQSCCLPDDTCQQLSPECCLAQGGIAQGAGTICTAPESCCMPDNTCQPLDPLCCAAQGGQPGGPGSSCPATPCCFVDGTCAALENSCACADDCGPPPTTEANCTDDLDNDCDAEIDCEDADCSAEPICSTPPDLQPDPTGINKSRFISFSVSPSPVTSTVVVSNTALRVRLNSLHHVFPLYTGGPSVPFTSFEGQVRWVGPPTQYIESNASPTPFYASSLQCVPHYQDWSTVGLLHVTGSAVVPSSIYEVENVAATCMGNEASCTAVSAPLSINTTRWGDVETPYNPPSTTVQPDLGDIGALVNKFRSAAGAPIKARALLAGDDAFGNINTINLDLGFGHIAVCVDAFKGKPYPHTIQACP